MTHCDIIVLRQPMRFELVKCRCVTELLVIASEMKTQQVDTKQVHTVTLNKHVCTAVYMQ